jgi:hypothetical protein
MGRGRERAAEREDVAAVEQREVVCVSEDDARDEVERQQAAEPDRRAEWIYLRNASEVWVARRVDRYPVERAPVSLKQAAKEEAASFMNPLEWPWLLVP